MASEPLERPSSRSPRPRAGRRPRCGAVVGLLAIGSFGLATPAAAQPPPDAEAVRDAARELGREGVRRYDEGDWEGARQAFRQAYRLMPAPTLALREARALVKLSRLVEAAEAYDRAASVKIDLSSPPAFRDAVTDALLEAEALRPRIPRVVIKLDGADVASPGLTVRVDGVAVPASTLGAPRPIDPGAHRIEAVASGRTRPVVETVSLRESELRAVVLRVEPPVAAAAPPTPLPAGPPPRSDGPESTGSQRIVGWCAIGLGSAALAVGVTTGILTLSRKSDLDDQCVRGRCPPSAEPDLEAFRTFRTVSTIGYVTGALAVGTGVALLLTATDTPQRVRSAHIEPWVGPGRVGLRGAF